MAWLHGFWFRGIMSMSLSSSPTLAASNIISRAPDLSYFFPILFLVPSAAGTEGYDRTLSKLWLISDDDGFEGSAENEACPDLSKEYDGCSMCTFGFMEDLLRLPISILDR
uniref:Secreted protein n=1 Tax=Angiostrongylus cantonensis TaxID=6313 RepID=A0A0K0DRJ2_ANGCA